MPEIRITEVAAMLGKELGKEFKVKDLKSGKISVAFFDNYGMRAYVDGFPNEWKTRGDILMRLIFGTAVIVDE